MKLCFKYILQILLSKLLLIVIIMTQTLGSTYQNHLTLLLCPQVTHFKIGPSYVFPGD